jgi:predicted transcriptional regulator of viral defense system
MSKTGRLSTAELFASRPVFSLAEATDALAPPGGRAGTVERLKHHVRRGRLKAVTRGVYAVVPPGRVAASFEPDPLLVAATTRPDGVFCYHSALELLGVAHSASTIVSLFTQTRRTPLELGRYTVRYHADPGPIAGSERRHLGVRRMDHRGILVQVTGPERTLVEALRRPGLAGGAEEVVQSAAGFAVLDLGALEEILECYDVAGLWAAVGWFLDRFSATFHVPGEVLARFEQRRPRSPQYLERGRRGGVMSNRWNLIVREAVARAGEAGGG